MIKYSIAVIAGDGVGPEVIPQTRLVLEKTGVKYGFSFAFEEFEWGAEHYFRHGKMAPPAMPPGHSRSHHIERPATADSEGIRPVRERAPGGPV
jgi:isocitrate/isopropylmalate dehydrogenase